MTFWAYMLHCRGGAFYTGHTDNLGQRLAQHKVGLIPGYTAARLPVELVWSEEFPTRPEALEAERRIKGWSRAKKLALIRGDGDQISALARHNRAQKNGAKKNGASTSSARTGGGGGRNHSDARKVLSLICHPDAPARAVQSIKVRVDHQPGAAPRFHFIVEGQLSRIVIPPTGQRRFVDGLWKNTCFEVFSKGANAECYDEYNLSPSGDWAAYGFSKYRADMDRLRVVPPDIQIAISDDRLKLSADVALRNDGPPWQLALSAVIEETDGTKSYWALRHPPGAPDFHHPDCFALTLAAPGGA